MAMDISVDFEKADKLGVVFEPGSQLYMWYVEILVQTHNDVARTFYDAINVNECVLSVLHDLH